MRNFCIGGLPIPLLCSHHIDLIGSVSAGRQYGRLCRMTLLAGQWYRRAADTREVLPYLISIVIIIFEFQLITLVSVAHRYQRTVVMKFMGFMTYQQPADTLGVQRNRCVHLHVYRWIALLCRRIQSSCAHFVLCYRRIDPSYRRLL